MLAKTVRDRAPLLQTARAIGKFHMGSVTTVLRYEVLLFLTALALIVAYQLLTGKINTRRMLFAKRRDAAGSSARRRTGELSPSRIQLLVVTIGVSIYLLAKVVRDPGEFTEIPTGLLVLVAGSQIVYLARMANNLMPLRMFRRTIRRSIRKRRSRSRDSQN